MTRRVMLQGRLAFPVLRKPEQVQGQGEPRYGAAIIIEDPNVASKAKKAMLESAKAKWADKGVTYAKALVKQNKVCLADGDNSPDIAGFPGNTILRAAARQESPPRLVVSEKGRNVVIPNEEDRLFYGGCYVNVIVEFWAQDNQFGKRLNCQLLGVQFVKDGDPFSGARPVEVDEFEVIETEAPTGDIWETEGEGVESSPSTPGDDDEFEI